MNGFLKVISEVLLIFAVSGLHDFKKIIFQQQAGLDKMLLLSIMPRK